MKGRLQLVSCVCIVSVSDAQELTAIHINLKGIASALVPCFTQEVLTAINIAQLFPKFAFRLVTVRKTQVYEVQL